MRLRFLLPPTLTVGGGWGGGAETRKQPGSKSGSRADAVTHAGAFDFLPRQRSSCGAAGVTFGPPPETVTLSALLTSGV